MSIGGRVIEVIKLSDTKAYVNVADTKYEDETAVYVNPDGYTLEVGDSLWWQSGFCYWKPKADIEAARLATGEVALKKLGNSGVSRPLIFTREELREFCDGYAAYIVGPSGRYSDFDDFMKERETK